MGVHDDATLLHKRNALLNQLRYKSRDPRLNMVVRLKNPTPIVNGEQQRRTLKKDGPS